MTTVFREWMHRSIEIGPPLPAARLDEQRALIEGVADALDGDDRWNTVTAVIHRVFGHRGWAWNGVYARHQDDQLALVAAHGPPVCATIDRRGGVGSSGMCWDSLLMNQTLVAADVKRWPGYVSCDDESNLDTVAGMVSPIRNGHGTPIAVWDLDATQPLYPEDGPFMGRVFATLSVLCPPDMEQLLSG